MHRNVGECRDNLRLWREIGALLELEIANGSGEGKVAVDTAKVDKAPRSTDARLFAYSSS